MSEVIKNTIEEYIGEKSNFHIKGSRFSDCGNIRLHFHEYYEIEIIAEGSGIITLNGKEISFKKGMVFFILPNDFHEFCFFEPTTIYNISFCENVLFENSSSKKTIKKTNTFLTVTPNQLKDIITMCDTIIKLKDINAKSRQYLLKSVLELFPKLYTVERVATYSNIAQAHIENRFKENISAKSVARECSINEDYLNFIFKKEFGFTVTEYIRKKRLEYADILLKSTDLPISEIAFNSGFQSIQTFNRLYKKTYNMSPTQNRKYKTEQ